MRVAFAGTPEFAAQALAAIIAAGHVVPLVLTQPDRPSGRGMKLSPSPVKVLATAHGLTVDQPASLKSEAARESLRAAAPDVLVVAAYGLILPQAVLDLPARGCLNIHASLLPRWRGAAPIQRAIAAGDTETGITIMQMDEGLDTGAMLRLGREAIQPDDSTASLHDRLARLGGELLLQALLDAAAGRLAPVAQPAEGVTYAHKIDKSEAALDWSRPAAELERRLRAFDPFPGAHFSLGDQAVKVWRAEVIGAAGLPGEVLAADAAGITVACGEQALRLTQLQRPGGKRVPAREFLAAQPLSAGTRLTA